jgi:DNA-binding beta-propeller fold protein YncE
MSTGPGNDPFSGSNVQNVLQHTLSPKIVRDTANTGYKLETDLIGINNVYVTGSVYSNGLDIVGKITNITGIDNLTGYKQLYINETTGKIYYYPLSYFVRTVAGDGTNGSTDGSGTSAKFSQPSQGVIDGSGNLYIADYTGHRIRKITFAGVVSTIAGSGVAGHKDDTETAAQFNSPNGITIDNTGTNLYVADTENHVIRKIVISTGVVTTIAGNVAIGIGSFADDTGTAAKFNKPYGITIDSTSSNLYVADKLNNRVRKIVISTAVVTTLAGSGLNSYKDDTGTTAEFPRVWGITIDSSANLYVIDGSSRIRKIVISTAVVTTLAGSGGTGNIDATGTAARFSSPRGITADNSGNLYVADTSNHSIRKIVIDTAVVTTIAGNGATAGYRDGLAISAEFSSPLGVVSDSTGDNIYVLDSANRRVRKIEKISITL